MLPVTLIRLLGVFLADGGREEIEEAFGGFSLALLGCMMVYMPDATVELSPSKYWSGDEAKTAQRIYVSFCELAAAVLDFAEGLNLLRRDERRQGAARLNWAATAFYYSLVHSARFLVFTAVGDFPTGHGALQNAFRASKSTGARTNWLQKFAPSTDGKYTERVSLQPLLHYWSAGATDHNLQAQLEWFADALTKAKKLREDNNYECLLIAHEYRHEYLQGSFRDLATTMAAVSRHALTVAVNSYACVLRSEGTAEVDTASEDGGSSQQTVGTVKKNERLLEAGFIGQYVQTRIVDPVKQWYGTGLLVVATEIEALMAPLTTLYRGENLDVERIEELVSIDLFGPKHDLMAKYREKIQDLQQLLNSSVFE